MGILRCVVRILKREINRKYLEFPLDKDSPKMFVRPYLISAK